MARSCDIVGGSACEAPPPGRGLVPGTVTRCYVCGGDVCRAWTCSVLHRSEHLIGTGKVRTRRPIRTCARCLTDRYGDRRAELIMAEASGDPEQIRDAERAIVDDRVIAERRALADHTRATLARTDRTRP